MKIIQLTWLGNAATLVSRKMKEGCGENEGIRRSRFGIELVMSESKR